MSFFPLKRFWKTQFLSITYSETIKYFSFHGYLGEQAVAFEFLKINKILYFPLIILYSCKQGKYFLWQNYLPWSGMCDIWLVSFWTTIGKCLKSELLQFNQFSNLFALQIVCQTRERTKLILRTHNYQLLLDDVSHLTLWLSSWSKSL